MSQDEDEWEYEFDQDATETFLLDLDLTSLNGGLRSNIPGKRPLDRPEQTSKTGASNTDSRHQSLPTDEHVLTTPRSSIGLQEPFAPTLKSLQILDLDSANPIVSYENEVYSCEWSDMVGTNLFFASASNQWPQQEEPVQLLGMSRIRLVAHRAKTAVKQNTKVRDATQKGPLNKRRSSLPNIVYLNPAFKRQADFLERLRDAKRKKEDLENERSVVSGSSKRSTS